MGKMKRKHDIKFKLEVIKYAEQHAGEATARHFNIDPKQVRDWRSQKDNFLRMSESEQTRARLGGGGRKKNSEELEVKMCEWIQDARARRVKVSRRVIRTKAKELYSALGDGGPSDFTASAGWLDKFLMRNGLAFRRSGAAPRGDAGRLAGKLATYVNDVTRMIARKEIKDSNVIAMAETEVWLDTARSTTGDRRGLRSAPRTAGHDKSHVTVVLAANAEGSKLKPYVVFRSVRDAKALRGVDGAVVSSNHHGRMNDRLTADWLQKVLGKPGVAPRLLVWDSAGGHTSAATAEELRQGYDVATVVVPEGCAEWIHAPDVAWNRPFVAGLQECYDGWMAGEADKEHPAEGHVQAPAPCLLVNWVLKVWDELDSDLLKRSFKVCGLTVAPDGSEDHLIGCFKEGEPWASGREVLAQARQQGLESSGVEEEEEEHVIVKEELMSVKKEEEEELVSVKEEEEEEVVCVKVENL